MPLYKIFTRAPTAAELKDMTSQSINSDFNWQAVEGSLTPEPDEENISEVLKYKSQSRKKELPFELPQDEEGSNEWILPPATLNVATQRISDMYKNVIFADEGDDEDSWYVRDEETGQDESRLDIPEVRDETRISWPPTNPDATRAGDLSRSRMNTTTQLETQNTTSTSYAHTSTSSIMAFPTFIINLHTLSPLSPLISTASKTRASSNTGKWSQKVNLLVAVLEVDGPDAVLIKKGPDAGKEVGILKLILGDESGAVCKLTAWRETADQWGGVFYEDGSMTTATSEGVQRGDIVYLTNVLATLASQSAPSREDSKAASALALTASPNHVSRLNICYRTLPSAPFDRRFRPDLRLAASDPGVKKVAGVVAWLASVVGLSIG